MTSWVVCQAFLNHCDEDKKQSLTTFLSPKETDLIKAVSPPTTYPLSEESSPQKILPRIHPSWIAPFVRQLSESTIRLVLSSLEENQSKEISELLHFSFEPLPLKPLAASYFHEWLWGQITETIPDLFPFSCLPASPLNALLSFDHQTLVELISFLGLYDLATEIRHIIDNVKLKKIYSSLSKEQFDYFKSLAHKKDLVAFRIMNLNQWEGDISELKTLFHHRGLNRLAKVCYTQSPSLIWYLRHFLDVERASIFSRFCVPLNEPRAVNILIEQVEQTALHVQMLKTKDEK